jgi:hypothetical protein
MNKDEVFLALMSAAKKLRLQDIDKADALREEAMKLAKGGEVSKEAMRTAAYL